ncbi:MAG: FMN-binding protein [Tissierellia bacterium]|nr:FMN-binding protein [Tissierellia bacterium]
MKKTIIVLVVAVMMMVMLVGCGGGDSGKAAIYTAGTIEKTVPGYGGDMVLKVTFTDSAIKEILVTSHEETENVGSVAVEELPFKIVEKQSTEVETITGATISSNAIIDGVNAAIEEAKLAE